MTINIACKAFIIFFGLLFMILGSKQNCKQCKYQAIFGGLVYLGFVLAPILGVTMTVTFLISQYFVSKIKK